MGAPSMNLQSHEILFGELTKYSGTHPDHPLNSQKANLNLALWRELWDVFLHILDKNNLVIRKFASNTNGN